MLREHPSSIYGTSLLNLISNENKPFIEEGNLCNTLLVKLSLYDPDQTTADLKKNHGPLEWEKRLTKLFAIMSNASALLPKNCWLPKDPTKRFRISAEDRKQGLTIVDRFVNLPVQDTLEIATKVREEQAANATQENYKSALKFLESRAAEAPL